MLGLLIATVLGMSIGIAMSQARWIEQSYCSLRGHSSVHTDACAGSSDRILVRLRVYQSPHRDRCHRHISVISSTLFGLQSAERGQHELFTLHKANRLVRLRKLQLPAAMPAIFTGLQVAATLAVVGAVVDFFFKQGDAGIGVLIDLYRARLQSEQLFAASLLACLLGVAVFWFFGLLTRLITGPWYGSNAYDRPQ